MKKQGKTFEKKTNKKNINLASMLNALQSYLAQVILAGLAFVGVQSLVDAKPAIQTGIAVLVVLLLTKTALHK